MKHKLAIIIPTRNRLELLVITLNSIKKQSVLPYQIIVVDGSDQPLEKEIKKNIKLDFTYLYVNPPSLTKQRNAGICALDKRATLVCYLDDDVVVEKDAIKNVLQFWEAASDKVGGVSFNIINNHATDVNVLYRIFQISSKKQGVVLKSGFVTTVHPKKENVKTEWLCGGATIWRKHIVDTNKYDEWFVGTAYFEDVDFSYRIGKKYELFVLHDACIQHNPPPFIPRNCVSLGEMIITYRYYFVKKHFKSSLWPFYFSTLGSFLTNLALSIKKLDMTYFYQSIGNFKGFMKIIAHIPGGIRTDFRE